MKIVTELEKIKLFLLKTTGNHNVHGSANTVDQNFLAITGVKRIKKLVK